MIYCLPDNALYRSRCARVDGQRQSTYCQVRLKILTQRIMCALSAIRGLGNPIRLASAGSELSIVKQNGFAYRLTLHTGIHPIDYLIAKFYKPAPFIVFPKEDTMHTIFKRNLIHLTGLDGQLTNDFLAGLNGRLFTYGEVDERETHRLACNQVAYDLRVLVRNHYKLPYSAGAVWGKFLTENWNRIRPTGIPPEYFV